MKKYLITCAMLKEAEYFIKRLGLQSIDFCDFYYKKIYNNIEIDLLVTGVGKQLTAMDLIFYMSYNEKKPDRIFNFGFVGSNNLPIGTLVSPKRVYNYERNIPDEPRYIIPRLWRTRFSSF